MYIETSSPRRQGDKAFLFSKSISAGQKCLKFFYHMYGPHVDTLNVYATSNTSNFGTTLWSKRGSQGNQWKPANVSLSLTQASQVRNEVLNLRPFSSPERDFDFLTFCSLQD